ncbi:MAG: type IV toxin-antitoxin system AbiEi family antitoxin domain-containing protein [Propionibacteriaceae bacterium]
MDVVLEALMATNGGFFTRGQALDAGLLDRDLYLLLRVGELVKLRHGAYTSAAEHRVRTPTQRHVVLVRAVMAAQRRRVAATGLSAAAVWGLELCGLNLDVVHLLRLEPASARTEAGVFHHVVRDGVEHSLTEVGGIVTTDLPRTVWDLARYGGIDAGVVAADSALRRDPSIADDLQLIARRLRFQPRARRAWCAIQLADGRSESAGESLLRIRFGRFGLPLPVPQYVVRDDDGRFVGRADFGWPDFRHLGEFDGKIKYGKLLRPGESPTDVVVREKRREDLMRRTRRGMTRFTWYTISDPVLKQTMRDFAADLEQSRRLYC